jgi:hypothetical protein
LASTDSPSVAGAADDEPADHDHLIPMQMVNGFERRIPRFPPVLALAILGFGSEERQVLFKDFLNAEEDVAEAGLRSSRRFPLPENRLACSLVSGRQAAL